MTGKRILLISQCFAPQNKIGAVRPTKLAKYLTRMGYEVTVLCGKDYSSVIDPLLQRDLSAMPGVHCIAEKSLLRRWKQRKPHAAAANGANKSGAGTSAADATKKKPWLDAIYLFMADRADAAFARACKRAVKQMGQRYDVVLSTYGPLSVHTAACYVKNHGYAKRWIADFRDETAVPFPWQRGRLRRYNAKVARNADAITAVSAGYLHVMGMEGRVVYNGFDPEDLRGFTAPAKRTDKLAFIHCGQMYGAQRDLSPFFQALAGLIEEGKIEKQSVALVYAGRDTGGFAAQATDAGLQDCLEGYGFMPRDESLRLQKSSHVLLLPAWNLQSRQGNIPGKLLEYMMLDMPVVCCVSGDVPHSEIAGILRETNLGVCYEQANAQVDGPLLRDYLQQSILAFQAQIPMPFTPNREAVAAFTSEGMAHKMANTIEDWT